VYNIIMQQVVSITSAGQLTIPKLIRDDFGMTGSVKAVVEKRGNTIIVRPKMDFWDLAGFLESKVKLNDKELKKARLEFSKQWAKND